MKKLFFTIGLFILVFFAFFVFPFFKKNRNTPLPNQKKSINEIVVYQKITVNDHTTDFIKHTVNQSTNALSLLKQTNQIKTQGENTMAFVTEINSVAADQKNKEYWAFYVNEKAAAVGAGSYQLKNNDKIEWKIEKY